MENQTPKNIWGKLFAIQKHFKTFNVVEDSEKVNNQGMPAYKYTPGWEIVEKIREKMDNCSLMLIQNIVSSTSTPIEYPVYKLINKIPMTFMKKEIYVELKAEFTWVDTQTGEQAGPFSITASGANGTDKSMASALALAERYFLLKFFRITTHEKNDEPDAHDSDTVPGIPAEIQQTPSTPFVPCAQQPAGNPAIQQQGYQMKGTFQATTQPAAQDYGAMAPPAYSQPLQFQQQQGQAFDLSNPVIIEAVNRLVNFEKGTPTHQQTLNELMATLSSRGINCFLPNFLENLTETAQAKRERRAPILK